ncbi:MAG TPA: DUF4115 domain-containing protein [Actinomycetes bacterium]|nr:DUF4115 domain-containing protein [Actinomycetes bacterium]
MGRHTQPGTGAPTPDTGFWVRAAAAGVVLVVALVWWVSARAGDDPVTTTSPDRTTSPTAGSTSTPSSTTSASPSPSQSPSAAAEPAKRAPLLAFSVKRKSYITVRVPGGRTIVSRLFPAGAKRTFDAKVLQVVNGRPSAVRFVVNGKPREPGPADQPETFTVRRR